MLTPVEGDDKHKANMQTEQTLCAPFRAAVDDRGVPYDQHEVACVPAGKKQ